MGWPPIEMELCAYLADSVKAEGSQGSGQALLKERGHALLSARSPERQGPRPASGEGKLELTTAPWSKTTATGIPEGFRSGLPW